MIQVEDNCLNTLTFELVPEPRYRNTRFGETELDGQLENEETILGGVELRGTTQQMMMECKLCC